MIIVPGFWLARDMGVDDGWYPTVDIPGPGWSHRYVIERGLTGFPCPL